MTTKCVLVVDDDESLRETLVDALEDQGFTSTSVANGKEALDWLHVNGAPCVILLDLMMPVMNGWDFLSSQKKDPALADIPVVVLSASHVNPDQIASKLTKPVDFNTLLRTVRQYC